MPRLQSKKASEGRRLLRQLRRSSKEELDAKIASTPAKELLRQLFLMLKESGARADREPGQGSGASN